uniref:Uncharacterized protein LOC102804680 n=1 Tax=Saccoglossus kowalevskii TaxID=10224 RepID=A0ABM0MRW5_SACKO
MSSTQANESFHNTVASKAPKNRHYSKSESLNIRIAAAVSQKNSGYTYVCSVNKENGLSPGVVSQVRGIKLDDKARKRKMQTENKEYKLRRIQLNEERNKKCNATEFKRRLLRLMMVNDDEYADPCQPIHPAASKVTGLTYTCGKLFHNFNLVPTLSRKDALESFIEWIPLNFVLVAHNCKNFDARIL